MIVKVKFAFTLALLAASQLTLAAEELMGTALTFFDRIGQRRLISCAALATVTCIAWPGELHAQTFPEKSIRFIVPFAPGGTTDILARLLGQKFTETWRQQVLVDNRGGGGGTIGADMTAKAPADGYTILLTAMSHATAVSFYRKLPYDLVSDLQAVSLIANQPNTIAVHPSLPAKSIRELIALARARPGQLAFSSSGNGSTQHLLGELFKSLAKVDMIHVAYKGTAPALTDLIRRISSPRSSKRRWRGGAR